jgi:hypothetical protein
MKELIMFIWSFPIIFMIHDFEEIIMINVWKKRNTQYIKTLKDKHIPFNLEASTASFAMGVFEEFIIISVVTLVSYITDNYIFWYGLFIAFTIHLIFHFIQWISFKKYVPAILTSAAFLPICIYIIYKVSLLQHFYILNLAVSTIIWTMIVFGNIYMLHRAMTKVDFCLEKYASE